MFNRKKIRELEKTQELLEEKMSGLVNETTRQNILRNIMQTQEVIDYLIGELKCPVCGEQVEFNTELEPVQLHFYYNPHAPKQYRGNHTINCTKCDFRVGGNGLKECIDLVKALGKGDE